MMKKLLKYALALALAVLGILFIKDVAAKQFCQGNVCFYTSWPIEDFKASELQLDEIPEQFRSLFSQTFTYLDRGKQCFAFISQDGRYVLKFFDTSYLKLSHIDAQSSARKMNRLLSGYKLAYAKERDYTALVFMQLVPSKQPLQVKLIDRFGLVYWGPSLTNSCSQ